MTTIMDLLDDAAGGPGYIHILPDGPASFGTLWAESLAAAQTIAGTAGYSGAVGVLLSNSWAAVRAALGIWLSGNTLVSLPPITPRQDNAAWRSHIASMCRLSGVEVILAPADQASDLESPGTRVVCQEALPGMVRPVHPPSGRGDLVQFTSGSTSRPKGVVLSGAALAANVLAIGEALRLGPDDSTLSWLPLSHDMGFVGMFLTPLAATGQRYRAKGAALMQPEHFIRDPSRWLGACSMLRASITTVPNFAFDLAVKTRARHEGLDLSAMRICITGAERVRAASVRAFAASFAAVSLASDAICPAYGMAENSLAVTMVRPDEQWRSVTLDDPPDRIEVVSTGRPLDGVEVRIAAAGEPLGNEGRDRTGEIQLKSPSLLSSYLGAEVPWTADQWFPTRDRGFLENGELFVLGRSDDTIIVDGRNIFPEDIEDAIADLNIRPNSAAAVPLAGRGVAIVAEAKPLGSELKLAAEAIMEAVSARTGVVVAALYFVRRGSLARTTSGKLQRSEIARLAARGGLDVIAKFGKSAD